MSSLHFTVSCETDGEYGQRVNIREAQAINLFDINVKSGEAWRRRGKTSVVDISHTKERHKGQVHRNRLLLVPTKKSVATVNR